ncbi:hypothetical protein Pmani_037537 [Petrolisthes manimaculis]|uniref:N-acetyltransferase domain-containing protein n=1 Tax=Petrolisthes manimaculis TaxID=1843537 RepID=A0AAE1TLE2_9EUCA|nr:hypothetical protein Pmani_037537 [Petrolisthes manimaculis]
METVGDFFWAAVLSEVLPQVSILAIAIAFIGLGIPLKYCIVCIPIGIAFIYVVVWSSHYFKAIELHGDLCTISETYMKDPNCGFWVAEVLELEESTEYDYIMNKTKKVEYDFMKEEELEARGVEIGRRRRHVVATVAITKSLHGGLKAFLRRMAVKRAYRRRGIATRLLDEVIDFCTDRCLEGIELVTTECHYKARELYYKRGFEARHTYFKYYLNVQQPMYVFNMNLKPPKAELTDVASF